MLPLAMREAKRAQIIEAEDVVGMRMRVEDRVDVRIPKRRACWRKVRAGVDEDAMGRVAPSRSSCHSMATEGRRRWSRGSLEVQTRQLHPRVGTPMEVPLPRNRMLALGRVGRRGSYRFGGLAAGLWALEEMALVISMNIMRNSKSAFCNSRCSFR